MNDLETGNAGSGRTPAPKIALSVVKNRPLGGPSQWSLFSDCPVLTGPKQRRGHVWLVNDDSKYITHQDTIPGMASPENEIRHYDLNLDISIGQLHMVDEIAQAESKLEGDSRAWLEKVLDRLVKKKIAPKSMVVYVKDLFRQEP